MSTESSHCCPAVIGRMREQKYGRILNIASVAGKEGNPNMTAFSASEGAVMRIAESLAKEWRRKASTSTQSRLPSFARAFWNELTEQPGELYDGEDRRCEGPGRPKGRDRRSGAFSRQPRLLVP